MLLLLCLFLGFASSQDLQCHVPGECTGLHTGIIFAETYNECLQNCKEAPDCVWFIFYSEGDTKVCHHSDVCPSISEENCNDCYTGQKECQPENGVCGVQGFCNGLVVATDTTQSANECLSFCQQFDDCNWYTFFTESQACILTEDCSLFDGSCSDCISGERRCYEESTAFDKLFVVGGRNAEYKAEIVDLSGENIICPPIPDYPGAEWGSVGTFIGNQALVCSGFLYTSYTVDQGFSLYVDLPLERGDHILVQINSTHFMLVGDENASRLAWIFDRSMEEWVRIQSLQYARSESQAGLVKYPDGTQAVFVAGGAETTSTEVFDLVDQRWQAGPDLPVPIRAGASVQYGDSFLIVGGRGLGPADYLDSIYRFDPVEEDWIEIPQKLGIARFYTAAFLVPSDFIQCL